MAIAFDAAGGTNSLLQPPTLTWSHTCTGSNLYLVVGVGTSSATAGTISGVTYNGVAMTQLTSDVVPSGSFRLSLWGLKAPATGAHNVVATISGIADGFTGTSASYTGVDQTTPTGTAVKANAATGTTATVNVTSATGELVVGAVGIGSGASGLTIGAGQTQRAIQNIIASGEHANIISDEAGAASVTHSWTWTTSTDWLIAAVPLKPVAAAGSPVQTYETAIVRTPAYPTSNRTWVSTYNLNLIGKDAFPPGRRGVTFELPPRKAPPAGPTWAWSYNLNLIGQDTFPPGRKPAVYDEVQPVSWRRDWSQNLLLTTLTVTAQAPLNQYDWPLPRVAPQPDRTWTSSAATLQLMLPPPGEISADVLRAPVVWRNGWALNLVLSTLAGQDAFPPGEVRTETPPPVVWRNGFALNLLQTTLAPAVDIPFAQYDWPLPQRAAQPDRTWATSFNLNLIGQDAFPPGEVRTETPPPVVWRSGFVLNLLQSTLAPEVFFPLNQYDWPLPARYLQPDRTYIQTQTPPFVEPVAPAFGYVPGAAASYFYDWWRRKKRELEEQYADDEVEVVERPEPETRRDVKRLEPETIERIDRVSTVKELRDIASGLESVQRAIVEALAAEIAEEQEDEAVSQVLAQLM